MFARVRSVVSARTLLLLAVLAAGPLLAIAPTATARDGAVSRASGDLGVPGVSEQRLRAWETAVLGPQHAAEHAALRAERRDPGTTAPAGGFRFAANAVAVDPSVGGQWVTRFDIPVMGINAAMLPTGKVLWYAYPNEPDSAPRRDEGWAVLWDPSLGYGANAFKRVDPPIDPNTGKSANIWCSGTSFLSDGRVLVTGGNFSYINNPGDQYAGLKHVYTFDPFSETWTQQPDMAHGRWYPSQLLMPDGRTVILQGLDETKTGAKNPDVEIFNPGAGAVGTITKQGTLTGQFIGDYYPHMFWMPDGKGIVAGPYTNDSWTFSNPGTGTFTPVDNVANLQRTRVWGNAVMVPSPTPGTVSSKILEIGGSDTSPDYNNAPATNTTEQYDEAAGGSWASQSSLNIGRSHLNTVLLPDGSMVAVGGGVGSNSSQNRLWTATPDQMQVELWNPSTRTWSLGPSQLENRAYHSTAILLPDATVLSAGDDRNGGFDRDTAEIYKPAYLFKGARPSISSAPAQIAYNGTFNVDTPDTNVTKAVLIAPGAATHAVDMNQRYVPLVVAQRTGGVTLTAPANSNTAVPGYYMLFLVNANGVPSVAKWVKLTGTAPPPPGGTIEKAQGKPGA